MIRKTRRQPLAFVACVVALASAVAGTASAAPTAWDTPAGDHGAYTYSMGQSATGNFGSGNTYSDGFYFLPAGLKASTVNNGVPSATPLNGVPIAHDEAADTASVILTAKPMQQFSRIASGLLGDFSIDGVGGANAIASMRVTNLDTSVTLSAPLDFGGTVPATSTSFANGIFDGHAAITLPDGWRNIRVDFDAVVTADALTGSSFIQAKDGELSVDTGALSTQIPLPAAALVAPVVAAVGYRARRKLGLTK